MDFIIFYFFLLIMKCRKGLCTLHLFPSIIKCRTFLLFNSNNKVSQIILCSETFSFDNEMSQRIMYFATFSCNNEMSHMIMYKCPEVEFKENMFGSS